MSIERKRGENGTLRERRKAETRDLILDAALEMIAANSFDRETHDELARRVGVARRTVYRYFPTRDSIIDAAWQRVNINPAGVTYSLPTDAESVTGTIADFFETVDANAMAVLVAMTTPPGRAARAAGRKPRGEAWRKALATEVGELPKQERDLPLAVLQLIRSGYAWVEMRDQWELTAAQMATAVGWATQVLLDDLKARKGRSLAST